MKEPNKKHLLKWNSVLWLTAMVLPGFFSVALASTKFPWPILFPLLLLGPMLGSNKMLIQAMGDSTDAAGSEITASLRPLNSPPVAWRPATGLP